MRAEARGAPRDATSGPSSPSSAPLISFDRCDLQLDELMRFAGRFFEEKGADYYVFGATAMNFWIPPRTTADLDVVLCTDNRRTVRLIEKLRANRFPITATRARFLLKGRMIKLPLGETELDLKRAGSDHDRQAFARSKVFAAADFRLRIAVPEDLVLFKLQSWRRQDQADIERLWKTRRDLDGRYIEAWLDRIEDHAGLPVAGRWKEIRGQS